MTSPTPEKPADDRGHGRHHEVPAGFVVEVMLEDGPVFAVCQTVTVVDVREGFVGIPPEVLRQQLKMDYRAAPMPQLLTGSCPPKCEKTVSSVAFAGQAGKNVTINIDQS